MQRSFYWGVSFVSAEVAAPANDAGEDATADAANTGSDEEKQETGNDDPNPDTGAAFTINTKVARKSLIPITKGQPWSTVIILKTFSSKNAVNTIIKLLF
eukprot:GFUD01088339.1.p2 GENE.GFUD01088339.1~~GFUD01088339.1.p2  ORF type:complete len:100 (-),score=29.39 GFUD01088339.1:312-611(-)